MSALSAQNAKASPVSPPSAERQRDSIRSWETIRPRLAPTASRTAISFCLFVARASKRFARLAQAISSTTPVIAISTQSGVESSGRIYDRPCEPGRTSIEHLRNCSRSYAEACANAASRTSNSSIECMKGCNDALACAPVTPGFNRPNAFTQRLRRSLSISRGPITT